MQPKRTEIINYYDCYEVGYVKLYCTGKGVPDGRNTDIIIRTLNKQGVLAIFWITHFAYAVFTKFFRQVRCL